MFGCGRCSVTHAFSPYSLTSSPSTPAQTEHRESGKLAAMKRVPIQDDTELDDFMVEIDILAECKHRNIVGLHEAYFYDQALWVSWKVYGGGFGFMLHCSF